MGAAFRDFFLYLVIYAVWLMALSQFGALFFQKRKGAAGKAVCFFVLLVAMAMLTTGNYLVGRVIKHALLILFFLILVDGDKWEKLGFAGILTAVWEFAREIVGSLLSICGIALSKNPFAPYERGDGAVCSILAFLAGLGFVYLLFCKTKLSEGNFLRGGKTLFVTASLLLFLQDLCGFGITRGVVMVSDGSGERYWDVTLNEIFTNMEVLVLSVLCMVISLTLLLGVNRLVEYMTADNFHKMEVSRYESMLEQYRKQTNVRHDMKNHIISLNALAKQGEWDSLKEYLSQMSSDGMVFAEDIETGNRVVNAIVNTKRQSVGQKNIAFECDINISRPLAMDDYDLCIIWGNILDNAIEAAGMAKEEKYVRVQAGIVKKNLVISVENSAKPEGLPEKFEEKNWGCGLRNVRRIVQKEKGVMEITVKKDAPETAVFEISIMLPVAASTVHDTD